jgi:hypothetical protein
LSKYVEKIGLPSTDYNTSNSTNYAKLCNIKTHINNDNSDISTEVFDARALLFFNVFSFTANTFSQTNLIIRLKTSESQGNKISWSKIPDTFKLVYVIENDGSYTFYAKCNSNEKVKMQLIEGFDGFVTYYYNSSFDTVLGSDVIKEPTLISEVFGSKGICSLEANSDNTGIIIDTPSGGEGFYPSRDGSISFGKPDRRFKGGFFTEQIAFPVKITGTPTTLINGTTFFHATSKKICTYYNGKWYCNGEEVTLS